MDGVVATGALAEGSRDLGRWWKSSRKKVVVEAGAQGLLQPRWSRAQAAMPTTTAAVPALVLAVAATVDDGKHSAGPGAGIVSCALLLMLMGGLNGERAARRGAGVAGRWLGGREHLAVSGRFGRQPAASASARPWRLCPWPARSPIWSARRASRGRSCGSAGSRLFQGRQRCHVRLLVVDEGREREIKALGIGSALWHTLSEGDQVRARVGVKLGWISEIEVTARARHREGRYDDTGEYRVDVPENLGEVRLSEPRRELRRDPCQEFRREPRWEPRRE
ncbi:hypothetical protein [Streptomyces sp. JNUCC 63]